VCVCSVCACVCVRVRVPNDKEAEEAMRLIMSAPGHVCCSVLQ